VKALIAKLKSTTIAEWIMYLTLFWLSGAVAEACLMYHSHHGHFPDFWGAAKFAVLFMLALAFRPFLWLFGG
jgi:hypothetical protein